MWMTTLPRESGVYHVRNYGTRSVAQFDASVPPTFTFFGSEKTFLANTLIMTGLEWWDEPVQDPDEREASPWIFEATATMATRAEAMIEVTRLLDKWTARCRAEFKPGA